MNTYVQILGCQGSVLYQSTNHSLTFSTSGRLQLSIAYDGMLLLKLGSFEYQIRQSDVVVYEKTDPQFKMVLYLKKFPDGKWILKINENVDQVFSCLNEKCYIVDKVQDRKQFSSDYSSYGSQGKMKEKENDKRKDKEKEKQKKEKAKKVQEPNVQQADDSDEKYGKEIAMSENNEGISSLTPGAVLVGASKGLGWGLKMTGKVLSKGFQAVGQLASKAVKPATDKVQVSQSTKANIDLAKKTSKSVLGFAATQVGNLFKFGKQTATNIGQRIQKTQKGQQLQESPHYQTIKSGTKTGVQVVSNIYDGVVNAVYDIGSGISKGTTKVISKKYGNQAGQAADGVMEGMGNVVKITRLPQDQAAKTFK